MRGLIRILLLWESMKNSPLVRISGLDLFSQLSSDDSIRWLLSIDDLFLLGDSV